MNSGLLSNISVGRVGRILTSLLMAVPFLLYSAQLIRIPFIDTLENIAYDDTGASLTHQTRCFCANSPRAAADHASECLHLPVEGRGGAAVREMDAEKTPGAEAWRQGGLGGRGSRSRSRGR